MSLPVRSSPWLLAALTFTGFAALAFEVAWSRALIPWVGGTAMAQVMTVAVYMLGLFLGTTVGSARCPRTEDHAREFVLVEAAAALLSCLVICGLPWFEPWIALFARGSLMEGDLGSALRGAAGGLLMLPATFCMGFAFPLAMEALRRRRGGQDSPALAYGLNTLGATAGTVSAGLLLLPSFGVVACTLGVAALDLAALALCWTRLGPGKDATRPEPERDSTASGRDVSLLVAVTLGGAISLALEVFFFRVLGMLLGPTARAFTVVLGSYVLGLGLGSLLIQPWLRRRPQRARALFLGCWIGVAAIGLILHGLLGARIEWFLLGRSDEGVSVAWELTRRATVAGALLLPLTLLFGASFPAAVASARGDQTRAAGRIYAFLTLGNILGLILAATWLLPDLGAETGSRALFLVALLVPLPLLRAAGRRTAVLCIAGAGLVAGLGMGFGPKWDWHQLNSAPYYYGPMAEGADEPRFLLLEPGFETTVAVTQIREERFFTLDGKTDGSTTRWDQMTQSLCGVLPLSLHPRPDRALLIGAGTGQSAADMLRLGVEHLDCAELSEGVVKALPYFREINHGVEDDPRFRLLETDGRTVLRYGEDRYDVIVSEPSNLWVPGVAHLFTEETFEEVAARLDEGGVFCQWLHAYALEDETFWSVVRTLLKVFPHVQLFKTSLKSEEALFVATKEPLSVPYELLQRRLAESGLEDHAAPGRALDTVGLLRNFVAGTATLRAQAGEGETTDDRHPRLEYAAERAMLAPSGGRFHGLCRELMESPGALLEDAPAEVRSTLQRRAETNRRLLDFLSSGRVEIETYRSLARELQDDPQALNLLAAQMFVNAQRAQSEGREDLVDPWLDEGASWWPGHEEIARNRLDRRLARRQPKLAREVLEEYRAVAFDERAWLLVRAGRIELLSRNLPAAEALFRAALERDDEMLSAYAGLGNCAVQRGDRAGARRWLEEARRRDPDNAALLEALERL